MVIAARPGQTVVQAVAAARALDYPAGRLEIIVARGRQPSVQRNAAIRAARGELIYFLDDDSVPERENLRRAAPVFGSPEVKMLGGPNLCPREAPELEQVFALVLASWLAFGPSRARYAAVGSTRATSEKELILCNLMARRDALLALGGFNEALYPNEENALMDELQKQRGKLIYDPGFLVYRHPRGTLRAFAKMLVTYGRGRAEQFRLHPTPGSALNLVPPLFLVYLFGLIAEPWVGPVVFVPLVLYLALVAGQGLVLASSGPRTRGRGVEPSADGPGRAGEGGRMSADAAPPERGKRVARSLAAMPLIVLTHVLYGVGFWKGLFTKLAKAQPSKAEPVTLERIG